MKVLTKSLKTLGIIPARGGSSRVPRKNLRVLGGKSLVARALETALNAKSLDRLVVSSDNDEVLAIARQYGDQFVLRRPSELATDTSLAIEYVRHALMELESRYSVIYDAVAIIQPSSPFTITEDIDAVVNLLERSGAESAATVAKVDQVAHPTKLKVLQGDRLVPYFEEESGRMAAHEIAEVYSRNGAVYAALRSAIERSEIIAADCRGYIMPRERSVDINDEIDFSFAEFLVNQFETNSK